MHSTAEEAQKIIDVCFQLQEEYNAESREAKALNKLLNHAKNFKPKFTASGFFKLNKSVVLTVVANVATYLIITVQFKENEQKSSNFKY